MRDAGLWRQAACGGCGFTFRGMLLLALAALLAAAAEGQTAGDYTLFHPVPESQLGKLHTDRPTKAASPFTVAPGHVQLEMGALTYTHDDAHFGAEHLLTFGINDVRIGLLNNVEIGIISAPVRWRELPGPGGSTDVGFGNLTLRVKDTLWGGSGGNSPGSTALALMPFLTLPTGTDGFDAGGVQGGLAVPFALKLPAGFDFQTTPSAAITAVRYGEARRLRLADAAALFHPIAGRLRGFAEYYIEAKATRPSKTISTLDLGLLYDISHNAQLNFGVYPGLSDAAPGLHLIFGFARRF